MPRAAEGIWTPGRLLMPAILPAARRGREWRSVMGFDSATLPRYPDGMPAADPITPGRRRIAIRLPRPLWIGAAAAVLSFEDG